MKPRRKDRTQQATTGRIFDIQRFCIHDGPGIRTTVFLKGCPMRCLWCHNPEGIAPGPQLSFLPESCVGCGACIPACPRGAHLVDDAGRHALDRARCTACGRCAEACCSDALERIGQDTSVAEVFDIVRRDEPFYRTSGGGMTLSGGEPMVQFEFSAELLRRAKVAGIHTAVETCGLTDFGRFEAVLEWTDLWLYDLKETDASRHVARTGARLEPVLENLRALVAAGAAVVLRLPVVPGVNDRPDHFAAVGRLAGQLPGLRGVEVLAYHRLGTSKRERLGMEPEPLGDVPTPSEEQVAAWRQALRAAGLRLPEDS